MIFVLEKKWNQHITEKGDHHRHSEEGHQDEIRNMKLLLEEKNEEIISWRQRETANEDYTSRLARKLDRLMVENQNRAQKDLRERMNLLDDKNRLSVENANLKRQLEELGARLKVEFHPNPNIPIINGEPAYRDIPDVKVSNSKKYSKKFRKFQN